MGTIIEILNGKLIIENLDFVILYGDKKYPILDMEYFHWWDTYFEDAENEIIDVQFTLIDVEHFDQIAQYAKHIPKEIIEKETVKNENGQTEIRFD